MQTIKKIFMLWIFLALIATTAISATLNTSLPNDISLGVELELKLEMDKDGEHHVSGNLIVSNPSQRVLSVQHPENRSVLMFIVTDTLGNIVMPKALGKVDAEIRLVAITARSDYEYPFEHLRFLTGRGKFGFTLVHGEVYKVIAVFRPIGTEGPGFTSNEVLINIF